VGSEDCRKEDLGREEVDWMMSKWEEIQVNCNVE